MRVQWHACGSKSEDNLWELSSSVFTCWAISLAPTFIFLKYTVKIISENIFRLPTWSDWIWLDTFFFFTICVYVHTHVCAHVLLVCLWCTLCTCSSYFSLPCWWVLGVGFRLAGLRKQCLCFYQLNHLICPTLTSSYESGFHIVALAGFLHTLLLSQLPG